MTAPAPAPDPAAAARAIAGAAGGLRPRIALILGSGLGALASEVDGGARVPFARIPGFPATSVSGHAGVAALGRLEGVPVLALAGRFHMYEGHTAEMAALPVRVAHAMGATILFVSNAAGGIDPSFEAGDLMLIRDHLNLMFRNPLIGPVRAGDLRFPDMSAPYDAELQVLAREAARDTGVPLREGVYAGLLGPTYETPAEVRMLATLGAQAVGMSTVPEVIAARAMGMRVAGISCITNPAAGLSAAPLDHAEVLDVTTRAAERFQRLVRAFVRRAGAA
ncbi:MAG TPA: purine-nucleoside phosphorylase [Gemmatimonadaceae bacterium]|nr:purine-nucleoside phosphorylase [Gemmatimonadaceae bacterium]